MQVNLHANPEILLHAHSPHKPQHPHQPGALALPNLANQPQVKHNQSPLPQHPRRYRHLKQP